MTQSFYDFPAELAPLQVRELAKKNPEIKSKFFTVLAAERNGNAIYKIRAVNFNGLEATAKWCENEESRDKYWWNNYDITTGPGLSRRGFTSYIPKGVNVDIMIEVHDTKSQAEETKEAFMRFEANLVREVPDSPERKKAETGKRFDLDRLVEEEIRRRKYHVAFLATK